MLPLLEEVFKTSGIPTYTFVRPQEYERMIVGLRTPGRGLVVEGPSGIGKTTGVLTALRELGLEDKTLILSARKEEDRRLISELPAMTGIGPVLIDDFHRLDAPSKQLIADHMKALADEERTDSKLILVGINKAGDSLVKFAADLNNRLDTISLETNSEERIDKLIALGEKALNITLNTRKEIIGDAHGSFHIAQLLCRETCLSAPILEAKEESTEVKVSLEVVREKVLSELGRVFFEPARHFATGPKLRREGRAPYLHMLRWLSESEEWSIQLDQTLSQHPEQRGSVGQVVDKKFIDTFMAATPELADAFHYAPETRTLSIEDPKLIYYLKNLIWNKFARQVGYLATTFESRYDFALSFAGADRDVAEALNDFLTEAQVNVFYDRNEQHRILAANVEDYLAPIYRSEAEFVIAILGAEYPKRIWTKFESEQFRKRFGENSVIPVWFTNVPQGMFDETTRVGGAPLTVRTLSSPN
ncbi:TIR domain-containing protein [Granulicella sp. 5B5]|uniref:TIR domain-containing protein n=1 Tax=Granulicella sp. 5B5 TaxID=1617967 RepID=UPI001C712C16|nr:TIR domain-containing protein [Granulicella sp. 5B5]